MIGESWPLVSLGIEAHFHHHIGVRVCVFFLLLELQFHAIEFIRIEHPATVGRNRFGHVLESGAANLIDGCRVVHQILNAALQNSGSHNAVPVQGQTLVESFNSRIKIA